MEWLPVIALAFFVGILVYSGLDAMGEPKKNSTSSLMPTQGGEVPLGESSLPEGGTIRLLGDDTLTTFLTP